MSPYMFPCPAGTQRQTVLPKVGFERMNYASSSLTATVNISRNTRLLRRRASYVHIYPPERRCEVSYSFSTHQDRSTQSDENHPGAAAQGRISPKGETLNDELLSVLRPGSLGSSHPFYVALLNAYRTDCGMPTMQGLGKHQVQWAKRLKFDLP
jgi:hypothetical protein